MSAFAQVPHYQVQQVPKNLNTSLSTMATVKSYVVHIYFALSADSLMCWKTWFTCTELVHAQTMKLLSLEDMLKIMMTFMLHKMLH